MGGCRVKSWTPLHQDESSDCMETCASSLLGRHEPFVLPRTSDCNWLELQLLLRREHGIQLRHHPLTVTAYRDVPRFGAYAMLGLVDDPDSGKPHAVITQRDRAGALAVTHDPTRAVPADSYRVTKIASFEKSPGSTFEPFQPHNGCVVAGCSAWRWHGY